ncbi:hypothetical protein B0T17DRAFT_503202 [Bombardia bombarda]|uniref:Uncharacterized protein n=1 Tax=Bombardia bombarda TaxID=252184 RepID=A0AA39XLZ1_9PEZI|nr:hypothetical protein B0T17DRAFT_503202 [Bombardia bombarda]
MVPKHLVRPYLHGRFPKRKSHSEVQHRVCPNEGGQGRNGICKVCQGEIFGETLTESTAILVDTPELNPVHIPDKVRELLPPTGILGRTQSSLPRPRTARRAELSRQKGGPDVSAPSSPQHWELDARRNPPPRPQDAFRTINPVDATLARRTPNIDNTFLSPRAV